MLGQGDTRGILEMAIDDIFQQISLQKGENITNDNDENDKENQNLSQNNIKYNSNNDNNGNNSNKIDRDFILKLSFIEIYNEKIYDLLSSSKNLVVLREDKKTFCSDATEIEIFDHQSIIKALKKGKISFCLIHIFSYVLYVLSHSHLIFHSLTLFVFLSFLLLFILLISLTAFLSLLLSLPLFLISLIDIYSFPLHYLSLPLLRDRQSHSGRHSS